MSSLHAIAVKLYVRKVKAGEITLEEVPDKYRSDVEKALN
jgi:hypothetical protein